MYAASVANVELVRILLDRGANASFEKGKINKCNSTSHQYMLSCLSFIKYTGEKGHK